MQSPLIFGVIILCCSAAAGIAFFVGCRKAIAALEQIQRERAANAIQGELAARQARMTRYSMTQFVGTKASARHY